ncbi:MAG: YggT family protein [Coriobacteriia bacterium]|nr:YggT family protein [Coriobacteriia bacterium]
MWNINAAATDRRSQVHTEIRSPIEAVLGRLVWFVFGFIEVLIAIRFVLMLLGANAKAGFVQMVYGVSDFFMAPFMAILGTARVAGATFEWSALLAIAIYALVAWGAVAAINAISPREHAETVERVEKQDDVNVS